MEAWKGHNVHLEALGLLTGVPNWVCWMIGGAQKRGEVAYLHELRKTASRLGLSHKLKFLGERDDIDRLLGAANLFCQPNAGAEPFGIAFVEALAAGLPVVTSAIGGGREIVDESCGLLVPAGDAVSLASALRRLVTGVDLRRQMSHAAPGRARELCEPSRQLKRLSNVIENTVAAAGGRPKAWSTAGAVQDRARSQTAPAVVKTVREP
jgi:glycosyltransferase involved in cell wall biosynthesis